MSKVISKVYEAGKSYKYQTPKELRKDPRERRRLAKKRKWEAKQAAKEEQHKKYIALLRATPATRYAVYLRSDHWRVFRINILAKRGAICESCRRGGIPVQLHHLTYARLGSECDGDVRVLCDVCHKKQHNLA